MRSDWKEYALEDLLSYEQPTAYIVESTDYDDKYKIPVLTAGKSFILGYTSEEQGIYDALPVIIFDDFTTASQYVNFKFKVKSSAMKILTANAELVLPKFIFYRMQIIEFDASTHKRYWIQHYSKIKVKIPPTVSEQEHIVSRIEELFSQLDASVSELKTAQERLKVYRQAVLKEAFDKCNEFVPLSSLGDLGRGKSKHRPRNDFALLTEMVLPRVNRTISNWLDTTTNESIRQKYLYVEKHIRQHLKERTNA